MKKVWSLQPAVELRLHMSWMYCDLGVEDGRMRGRPPPSEQLGVGVDSYEFRHKRLSTVDEDELELEANYHNTKSVSPRFASEYQMNLVQDLLHGFLRSGLAGFVLKRDEYVVPGDVLPLVMGTVQKHAIRP